MTADPVDKAKICIEFEWTVVGEVQLTRDRLRFPSVNPIPGIYMFSVTAARLARSHTLVKALISGAAGMRIKTRI